jgi:hypothetical protein
MSLFYVIILAETIRNDVNMKYQAVSMRTFEYNYRPTTIFFSIKNLKRKKSFKYI